MHTELQTWAAAGVCLGIHWNTQDLGAKNKYTCIAYFLIGQKPEKPTGSKQRSRPS
jgi:hypothetical protein